MYRHPAKYIFRFYCTRSGLFLGEDRHSHPNRLRAILIHELLVVIFYRYNRFTVFGKQTAKCKKRKDHCEMATDCSFAKKTPVENAMVFLAFSKLADHLLFGIPH